MLVSLLDPEGEGVEGWGRGVLEVGGGEPLALEACSRSSSLWEGGGELGKADGEKGGTSKGEIEDRGSSSPSWGLVSLEVGLLPSREVGLLPTSSGCGLELLLVLWEIGVYRTILFSLHVFASRVEKYGLVLGGLDQRVGCRLVISLGVEIGEDIVRSGSPCNGRIPSGNRAATKSPGH